MAGASQAWLGKLHALVVTLQKTNSSEKHRKRHGVAEEEKAHSVYSVCLAWREIMAAVRGENRHAIWWGSRKEENLSIFIRHLEKGRKKPKRRQAKRDGGGGSDISGSEAAGM